MKKQRKCYIYTRVSTAIQVDGYQMDNLDVTDAHYNKKISDLLKNEALLNEILKDGIRIYLSHERLMSTDQIFSCRKRRRDGLHINAAMTYFVNALFVLRYWYDY